MARTLLIVVPEQSDYRCKYVIVDHFRSFMEANLSLQHLRVSRITYQPRLCDDGLKIEAETDRPLGIGDEVMLRDLARGFVGGWLACHQNTTVTLAEI